MIDAGEIVFRDAPVAVFGKAQVPVQVRRIGVCGSDVHVYHGKHPFAPYPVVQGHKFSGIIWDTRVGMVRRIFNQFSRWYT
jgi:L-iditol 2-dehydrogenase